MAERGHRIGYHRYDGGPDPLAPPADLGEALDRIAEDVMAGTSVERAMQEYLRRGSAQQRGLDDLAQQVARRRRELLKRNRLDGTMTQVKELLDKATLAERKQLARDLDDDARFAELRMGNLPSSTAAAVNELADYPWRSSEGREAYDQIRDLLGREMLDQRFAGMKQAMHGATDADRAAVQEMLSDLNELLESHRLGEDTPEQFEEFMRKHGEHFPDNPSNVDELVESLAARAAAAARFRNSLTPEQRAELDALAQSAFGSPELAQALSRLDDNLQALAPGQDWSGSAQFSGDQGVGLGEGAAMMSDLAELDWLSEQLSQQYAGASLDDVDLDALARQLGAGAAADARTLAELEKSLRSTGLVARGADGALRLSPKAMRQLGNTLLKDVAKRLADRSGQRDLRRSGAAGEPSGAGRAWEFGDTNPWDVTATLGNAIRRQAAVGAGAGAGAGAATATGRGGAVRIEIGDVEVVETQARTRAAVALLVDTSFSMVMEGRWVPMKRTALALHHLVATRFRGDELTLIGFGRHAASTTIEELVGRDGTYEQGTNLHHALMLANRHFRRHPSAQPVLLVVTDGEPTAHLEPDGEAFFTYPPLTETIALTVGELDASARLGAQITFFRLGDDPGLARFIDRMARRVDGRVVAPELDDLGAAVVGSYLSDRG